MDKIREYTEWLNFADEDYQSAEILYGQHKKPVNIICYHCQQAAEKYLKAYLVYKDTSFEKIHDLLKILDYCQNLNPAFSEIARECMQLNPFSVITRYPSELELLESDANAAIEAACKVGNFVKGKINDTDS